jgi:hypothetical protein
MREGSRGKAKDDHYVQSIRVCISVAVDYLREAEWKVLLFALWAFFRLRGWPWQGSGEWFFIKWQSLSRESGASSTPSADPPRSCPRRSPWFAALGFHFS